MPIILVLFEFYLFDSFWLAYSEVAVLKVSYLLMEQTFYAVDQKFSFVCALLLLRFIK